MDANGEAMRNIEDLDPTVREEIVRTLSQQIAHVAANGTRGQVAEMIARMKEIAGDDPEAREAVETVRLKAAFRFDEESRRRITEIVTEQLNNQQNGGSDDND
ncbi:MAG: hypothetical protein KDD43_17170 [Bdellovibrionales bacterium]|nr:hypothetical protein [Bdellovibrionales bacterium]